MGNDLIDQAVFLCLQCGHIVVALGIQLDLFQRLAGVLAEHPVHLIADIDHVLGMDLDIGGLAGKAAALPAGDAYLTLTVELFGPYDSAAAFARDCYTLTALAKQCTVPPEKLHFTWDARSPAESSLNTGSLLYTEDYSLDLSGAVQLDWTEQQMEQQNQEIYNYMHDIFGAEVVNLFDMKYNPEQK